MRPRNERILERRQHRQDRHDHTALIRGRLRRDVPGADKHQESRRVNGEQCRSRPKDRAKGRRQGSKTCDEATRNVAKRERENDRAIGRHQVR